MANLGVLECRSKSYLMVGLMFSVLCGTLDTFVGEMVLLFALIATKTETWRRSALREVPPKTEMTTVVISLE